jgi:hypothetical protein
VTSGLGSALNLTFLLLILTFLLPAGIGLGATSAISVQVSCPNEGLPSGLGLIMTGRATSTIRITNPRAPALLFLPTPAELSLCPVPGRARSRMPDKLATRFDRSLSSLQQIANFGPAQPGLVGCSLVNWENACRLPARRPYGKEMRVRTPLRRVRGVALKLAIPAVCLAVAGRLVR